jgi:hypothetical protein
MRLTQSETYGRPGVFAAIGRRWFLSVCCEAVLDWVIGKLSIIQISGQILP